MATDEPEIVEREGSWSYRIADATFGNYPSREAALVAAAKHARKERSTSCDADEPREQHAAVRYQPERR